MPKGIPRHPCIVNSINCVWIAVAGQQAQRDLPTMQRVSLFARFFCVDVLSKRVSPIEKNNKIGYNAYWIIQIQTVLFRVAFCAGLLFAQERGNYA